MIAALGAGGGRKNEKRARDKKGAESEEPCSARLGGAVHKSSPESEVPETDVMLRRVA